jgi:uncharacterized damage-inducible protein DinB
MPEDRAALLDHYRQSRAELLALLEGLAPADLVEPSLDGWSVKDHLAHLAAWDDIRAAEVARISAGYESAWKLGPELDEALNRVLYEARRNLSLEQVRWEFEASRERLLAAIAAATSRGLDPSLYGEAPVRSGHEPEHTGWLRRWRESRAKP